MARSNWMKRCSRDQPYTPDQPLVNRRPFLATNRRCSRIRRSIENTFCGVSTPPPDRQPHACRGGRPGSRCKLGNQWFAGGTARSSSVARRAHSRESYPIAPGWDNSSDCAARWHPAYARRRRVAPQSQLAALPGRCVSQSLFDAHHPLQGQVFIEIGGEFCICERSAHNDQPCSSGNRSSFNRWERTIFRKRSR